MSALEEAGQVQGVQQAQQMQQAQGARSAKLERLYTVLTEPHITEKATNIGELSNHYAFKVVRDATKREIKTAVETLFGVTVVNVTTLNVKGKSKRNFRGIRSRSKNWKKAYVRLAEGDDLDYMAIEEIEGIEGIEGMKG